MIAMDPQAIGGAQGSPGSVPREAIEYQHEASRVTMI